MTIDSELLDPRFHATCPARRCTTVVVVPIDGDLADQLLRIGAELAIR